MQNWFVKFLFVSSDTRTIFSRRKNAEKYFEFDPGLQYDWKNGGQALFYETYEERVYNIFVSQ